MHQMDAAVAQMQFKTNLKKTNGPLLSAQSSTELTFILLRSTFLSTFLCKALCLFRKVVISCVYSGRRVKRYMPA